MSDGDDDDLGEWRRAAAAETGRRLAACETEPFSRDTSPEDPTEPKAGRSEAPSASEISAGETTPRGDQRQTDTPPPPPDDTASGNASGDDGGPGEHGNDAEGAKRLGEVDIHDEVRPVPVFAMLTEPESTDSAPKRGLWEVVTEASKYYLDLDREMLQRVRGTVKPAPDVAFPSKLRDHDRGWVRLLRIVQLEVGEPAVFDIESLGGPEMLFTRRTTTYVLSLRQIGDSGEVPG